MYTSLYAPAAWQRPGRPLRLGCRSEAATAPPGPRSSRPGRGGAADKPSKRRYSPAKEAERRRDGAPARQPRSQNQGPPRTGAPRPREGGSWSPEAAREHDDRVLASLKVGQLVCGAVRKVEPHGVWVALEGVQGTAAAEPAAAAGPSGGGRQETCGFLPAHSISRAHVFRAYDHFLPGDSVAAVVVTVDAALRRVTLSSWQLEAAPGDMLSQWKVLHNRAEAALRDGSAPEYGASLLPPPPPEVPEAVWRRTQEGSLVAGTVTAVHRSGVVVRVEAEGGAAVEGLLDVRHMSGVLLGSAGDAFRVGDPVRALVREQLREVGRLRLSTRELEAAPGDLLRSPDDVFQGAEKCAELWRKLGSKWAFSAEEAEDNAPEVDEDAQEGQLVEGSVLRVHPRAAIITIAGRPGVEAVLPARLYSNRPAAARADFRLETRLQAGDLIRAVALGPLRAGAGEPEAAGGSGLVYVSTARLETDSGDMISSRQDVVQKGQETWKRKRQERRKRVEQLWVLLEGAGSPEGGWAPSRARMHGWLAAKGHGWMQRTASWEELSKDVLRLAEQRFEDLRANRTVVEGTVEAVKPFGAFVSLAGGRTGLLHVSQISGRRVGEVGEVLQPGQRIRALVASVDPLRGLIGLSTAKLEAEPGDMLRDPRAVYEGAADRVAPSSAHDNEVLEAAWHNLKEGSLVSGTVIAVDRHKAMVRVEVEVAASGASAGGSGSGGSYKVFLEGAIPHKYASRARPAEAGDVFSVGDPVRALVRMRLRESRKLQLSTRELEATPGEMIRDPIAVFERAVERAEQLRLQQQAGDQDDEDKALEAPAAADEARGEAAEHGEEEDDGEDGDSLQSHTLVSGTVLRVATRVAVMSLDGAAGQEGILPARFFSADPACTEPGFSLRGRLAVGRHVRALSARPVRLSREAAASDSAPGFVYVKTSMLESQPGDMLRDPEAVFARAPGVWADKQRERRELHERLAAGMQRDPSALLRKRNMRAWLRANGHGSRLQKKASWDDLAALVLQHSEAVPSWPSLG